MKNNPKEIILKNLSEIIPTLARIDPGIDNLNTLISSTFNRAGIPPHLVSTLSHQLTLYKIAFPQASSTEVIHFIEVFISPQIYTNTAPNKSGPIPSNVNQDIINIINNPQALSPSPANTMIAQFVKAGIGPNTASEIATVLTDQRIPEITYAITDHAPISLRQAAFDDLFKSMGLSYIQNANLSSTAKKAISNLSQLDTSKIYSSINNQYSQPLNTAAISDSKFFDSTGEQLHPYINFIFNNPLSDQLKTEAGKIAVNRFVSSAVGQKVVSKAIQVLGKKVVTSALTKLGATTAATVVGTPVLGAAVFITSEVISGLSTFIKKHSRLAIAITAGIGGLFLFGTIGAGILVAGLVFAGLSAFSTVLSSSGIGSGSFMTSSIGARAGIIFNYLAGDIIADNFWVIVFTVLSLPIIIAVFLIIINSGAYIVPPQLVGNGDYPTCWPVHGVITQGPPGSTVCIEDGVVVTCSHVPGSLNAIDIANNMGTPVYATHGGIAHVFRGNTGYGNYVIIDSGMGFSTLYGHFLAGSFSVTEGAPVHVGQIIALMDSTGNSTGNHLHYEFRPNPAPSINLIVPPYKVYGNTTGCFAEDQSAVH